MHCIPELLAFLMHLFTLYARKIEKYYYYYPTKKRNWGIEWILYVYKNLCLLSVVHWGTEAAPPKT